MLIFPELRQYLDEVYQQATERTDYVITRYRDKNSNLRTQLKRIIRKAGLTPWPKLFQNLRSTRQTELAEQFPAQVVCAWIGNSPAVAREHYLQVTDEHFEKATRKTTQQEAAICSRDEQDESSNVENPENIVISRGSVIGGMGGTGLEPGDLSPKHAEDLRQSPLSCAANSGALLADSCRGDLSTDADFAFVTEHWFGLPADARAKIIVITRAAIDAKTANLKPTL
jgi:hypothetical protein